jgi:hypothetical protein
MIGTAEQTPKTIDLSFLIKDSDLGQQLVAISYRVADLVLEPHDAKELRELGFPATLVVEWRRSILAGNIPVGFDSLEDFACVCYEVISNQNLRFYPDGSRGDLSLKRGNPRKR